MGRADWGFRRRKDRSMGRRKVTGEHLDSVVDGFAADVRELHDRLAALTEQVEGLRAVTKDGVGDSETGTDETELRQQFQTQWVPRAYCEWQVERLIDLFEEICDTDEDGLFLWGGSRKKLLRHRLNGLGRVMTEWSAYSELVEKAWAATQAIPGAVSAPKEDSDALKAAEARVKELEGAITRFLSVLEKDFSDTGELERLVGFRGTKA